VTTFFLKNFSKIHKFEVSISKFVMKSHSLISSLDLGIFDEATVSKF